MNNIYAEVRRAERLLALRDSPENRKLVATLRLKAAELAREWSAAQALGRRRRRG